MVDNSGGWSQTPLHGEEKSSSQYAPKKRTLQEVGVSVSNYHKKSTSWEQIQKVHHKEQIISHPQK